MDGYYIYWIRCFISYCSFCRYWFERGASRPRFSPMYCFHLSVLSPLHCRGSGFGFGPVPRNRQIATVIILVHHLVVSDDWVVLSLKFQWLRCLEYCLAFSLYDPEMAMFENAELWGLLIARGSVVSGGWIFDKSLKRKTGKNYGRRRPYLVIVCTLSSVCSAWNWLCVHEIHPHLYLLSICLLISIGLHDILSVERGSNASYMIKWKNDAFKIKQNAILMIKRNVKQIKNSEKENKQPMKTWTKNRRSLKTFLKKGCQNNF